MELTYFVDVILPLAVPKTYTYRVPRTMVDAIGVGHRVLVSFGGSKIYSALIAKIHNSAPEHYQAKYLEAIIDELPVVSEKQLAFWSWMQKYYQCHPGELMLAALPASLRLASETIILPVRVDVDIENQLTHEELKVYDALLAQNKMTMADISALLEKKTVYPIVRNMLEKGVIELEEEVKDRYKPLIKNYLSIARALQNQDGINHSFEELSRASKQQDVLMALLQEAGSNLSHKVEKSVFIKKYKLSASAVNGIIAKGILTEEKIAVDRIAASDESNKKVSLSEAQTTALNEIKQGFSEDKVALLQGVTGSGKTEIYIKLIEECLEKGKQALYLVPEIALTSQLTTRLEQYFGNSLRVYHSRFTNNERAEVWYKLIDGKEVKLIVGARSSVLMPFSNLGLIIVDEEHDASYKQQHPAPRYQARDAAILLAKLHSSDILLGSATPSLESYYNAKTKKYAHIKLFERYGKAVLPQIAIADLKLATKEREMRGDFSIALIEEVKEVLQKGEQVILFQNRRGFSPRWLCTTCAWVPECKNCDISLTYHKKNHSLRCHYCGYKMDPPSECLACGSQHLKMLGFGTEKIEEELSLILPDAKIGRMDYDSTRAKNAYKQIIHEFETGQIDVLVGTQMVTKGLDFDRVALVGVLSADQMLSFPDFRSQERAYQLITQVSGRAGRREKPGKVLIQSFNSQHWVLQKIMDGNWQDFYHQELQDRKAFNYPPFCRLIKITLKHRDVRVVEMGAKYLAQGMRAALKERVLGPEFPSIARVKNQFIMECLVKIDPAIDLQKSKEFISKCVLQLHAEKAYRSIRVIMDIDPY